MKRINCSWFYLSSEKKPHKNLEVLISHRDCLLPKSISRSVCTLDFNCLRTDILCFCFRKKKTEMLTYPPLVFRLQTWNLQLYQNVQSQMWWLYNNPKAAVKVSVFIHLNDGVILWMLLLLFFVYLTPVSYNFILETYNNSV